MEFLIVLLAVKKKKNHCSLISRGLTDVVKNVQRQNCETWEVVRVFSTLRPRMNYGIIPGLPMCDTFLKLLFLLLIFLPTTNAMITSVNVENLTVNSGIILWWFKIKLYGLVLREPSPPRGPQEPGISGPHSPIGGRPQHWARGGWRRGVLRSVPPRFCCLWTPVFTVSGQALAPAVCVTGVAGYLYSVWLLHVD